MPPEIKPEIPGLHPYLITLYLLLLAITLNGCGYSNPYVQKQSPGTQARNLLITTWQNRTNELGLESEYFRLFNSWFKKSARINVVFNEEMADLKLAGEISAIELPGIFYGPSEEALEIKIKLTVSFTLSDIRSNSILWQERQYIVYEPFIIDPAGERSEFNKKRALLRIGDEIAEHIYLRTHDIVNNLP